jgi:cytochrome c553
MKIMGGLAVFLIVAPVAQAADIEAGKQLAATVCAACHGANGVSVSDALPNLAAQRAGYIETQLKLFKDGTRKAPGPTNPTLTMQAIAAQLSSEDISNTAAYFASLPGAAAGAKSAQLPNVAKTGVTFPEGYRGTFTKYHTINFPVTKQVRFYYANNTAVTAAKAGRPLPDGSMIFVEVYSAKLDGDKPIIGGDGFFVVDKLIGYSAMARDAGWGKDIPEMLRDENWNYALFTADKQYRSGVNQAECLACHKPLSNVSYLFTLKPLAEAK